MKQSRYTEEQIIGILKQHEAGMKTGGGSVESLPGLTVSRSQSHPDRITRGAA
jgi:hypothetical protein